MSETLPLDLESRCIQILNPETQGEPLSGADYVLLAVATILVPAILIVIGSAL